MISRFLFAVALAAGAVIAFSGVPSGGEIGSVVVYADDDDDCPLGPAGGDTDGCGDHEPDNRTSGGADCDWKCAAQKACLILSAWHWVVGLGCALIQSV